ncbi:unnamed protein product [Polarella glacialis]|uniref:Uncharacterized protein n=1 Tax=Polarella glacialis TaxID=89957 RepID=A0A813LJD3_POLGL|nr:unnamed protein product [Polarella glacialis]
MLFILTLRASMQLRGCQDGNATEATEQVAQSEREEIHEGAAHAPGGSFLGNFKAYDPAAYRASGPACTEQDGEEGEAHHLAADLAGDEGYGGISKLTTLAKSASPAAMVAAVLLPFLITFLAEAGSGGWELRVVGKGQGVAAVFGGIGGCLLATLAACLLGFLVRRQAQESTLLYFVVCGLAALTVACVRMGALRLRRFGSCARCDKPQRLYSPGGDNIPLELGIFSIRAADKRGCAVMALAPAICWTQIRI